MSAKARYYLNQLKLFIHSSNIAFLLFFEIVAGLLISFLFTFLILKIIHETQESAFTSLDIGLSQFVYTLRRPFLTQLMIFVTNLGSSLILFFASLVIIILTWKHHKKESLLFSLIISLGVAFNISLKQIIDRTRPDISPLIAAHDPSFPSGHAMNSFIFYSLLSFYAFHFTRSRKLSTIVTLTSIFLILLIGFSRVYLGVHYPSDIIAGYIIGFWWFITALLVDKTITFIRIFKHRNNN